MKEENTFKLKDAVIQEMELASVLAGIVVVDPVWDRKITGVSIDSRHVQSGDLFIACQGLEVDGRDFIPEAIRRGAIAVIADTKNEEQLTQKTGDNIPVFYTQDLQQKIGKISARFYGHSSRRVHVIGITGTNGKTSTSHFIARALQQCQHPCAVIGTLGYGLIGDLQRPSHTTPDAIRLQRLLLNCYQSGVNHVAMEASSHALAQGRVKNIEFKTAVFTNLTRDHLDYHGDMESYGQAKMKLFQQFGLQNAIINADDALSAKILDILPNHVRAITYGLENPDAQLNAFNIVLDANGIHADVKTPWGQGRIDSRLLGRFNLSNLLAVMAAVCVNDVNFDDALAAINALHDVPGRMQAFSAEGQPLVVVDYAHTPDALEKVLQSLHEHCKGKLWCVFGCGGGRDSGKRPQMAKVAEALADHVIITDDNPRNEAPEAIVADILAGIQKTEAVMIEHDREQAIRQAIAAASEEDVVLIAGKGHEDYQIIGNQTLNFDDRVIVQSVLNGEEKIEKAG